MNYGSRYRGRSYGRTRASRRTAAPRRAARPFYAGRSSYKSRPARRARAKSTYSMKPAYKRSLTKAVRKAGSKRRGSTAYKKSYTKRRPVRKQRFSPWGLAAGLVGTAAAGYGAYRAKQYYDNYNSKGSLPSVTVDGSSPPYPGQSVSASAPPMFEVDPMYLPDIEGDHNGVVVSSRDEQEELDRLYRENQTSLGDRFAGAFGDVVQAGTAAGLAKGPWQARLALGAGILARKFAYNVNAGIRRRKNIDRIEDRRAKEQALRRGNELWRNIDEVANGGRGVKRTISEVD
jgi:hypothetical protein